jgi:hypothetical protein
MQSSQKRVWNNRGGPLAIVWLLISCAMPTVSVPSLPDLTLSNSRGTYILAFCTSTSSLSLLVLWMIKFCRFILFIETFWKFTTRIFISIFWYSNGRHGPQEELARFSYRLERKVENWRILLNLASCWNLWFKYSDFRK